MSINQIYETHKKAIVVASFGTAVTASLETSILPLEKRIQQAFPEYDVVRVFTSVMVRKRLAAEGIQVKSLEEALLSLAETGYEEVIVQSAHLTPGEEYEKKILAVAEAFQQKFVTLRISRPVLTLEGDSGSCPDDFTIFAKSIQQHLPTCRPEQEIVFMGHGSPHRHNPAYERLQKVFVRENLPVTIGVIEQTDWPNIDDVCRILKEKGSREIFLRPLLLTAGDHVRKDMAGDDRGSWKSVLEKEGYQVHTYLHGLGENSDFLEIFVQHIRDAVDGKYTAEIDRLYRK